MADAIDELKSESKSDLLSPKTVIKIKCRSCVALNDEHANYCNNCGEKL